MPNYRMVFLGNLLFAAAFSGSCFLQANIRESSDQSIAITVETVDSGGGRLTGGLFRVDSNVGGIAGDLSRSGPEPAQFTSKNGYLGQLFDAIGLAIELDPATVNEEGSAQLDVSQVFDDDTLLPLDPTDVDWSVISGPVISVLDSGLLNPSSTVQKVKGLIYADSGLIFAVSLHYILDDSWAGGQF